MDEQKNKLIEGMLKNSVDKKTADKIWQFIEPFARYGFNKSHAAGYAMIAYQTAYLKAHFPEAFMAALLTSDQDDLDKVARDISECEHMGISVLPPDVNESFPEFAVVPKTGDIRFALAAIKNVGYKVAVEISEERKKNGHYLSLEDFIKRLSSVVNKKLLESLTRAGALDRFGERASILASVPEILKFAASVRKNFSASQIDLFGEAQSRELKIELQKVPEVPKEERLLWEKELLGIYISEHPLDEFKDAFGVIP
ncbi:MAG: DNA polymerase III subunit alpha, partial [Candidatus Berkelbacteria bacterium]|nr:DNA polymerase III subunit alpha [Candidatus Berkelbacteria bacterium]